MKTSYEQPTRSSAEGVATACILIAMLAMGASTLLTQEPSAAQATARAAATNVAQESHVGKKS